ncbi:MAG: arylesterase [Pigmentiphaga sp.]
MKDTKLVAACASPIRQARRALLQLALLGGLALAVPALAQTAPPGGGSEAPVILVVGDSLSAEYGLKRGAGWVALLEQRLADEGHAFRLVNASISGDTTSGGASRLPNLLRTHQPAVVIVELGGNDALRGLPLRLSRDNLSRMVLRAQESGARVVLAGMQIPPNYGPSYAREFQDLFGEVAEATGAALVPFLLEGIATDETMFQTDRIHPNEAAQATLLDNVWPVLVDQLP